MTTVTARKIREHGAATSVPGGQRATVGRVYRGFLVGYPIVGRGMVIFRDPNGHRMVTTAVRRVLADADTLYVETENSVYCLTFDALPVAQAA